MTFAGMLKSIQQWDVTLKRAGMRKYKDGVERPPQAVFRVSAEDREGAVKEARAAASGLGYDGYAITSVKEVRP